MGQPVEKDALTREDFRALRRLAVVHRKAVSRRPDATADLIGAWDLIVAKLDRATRPIPPAVNEGGE